MVSAFSFGCVAEIMKLANLSVPQVMLFHGSSMECVACLALLGWDGDERWVFIFGTLS
jgi:hypothetical protein